MNPLPPKKPRLRQRPWTPKHPPGASQQSLSMFSTLTPASSRLVQIWLKRERVVVNPPRPIPPEKPGL